MLRSPGKYSFGAGQRTVIGVGATAKAAGYGMMFAYGVTGTGTGTYLGQARAPAMQASVVITAPLTM